MYYIYAVTKVMTDSRLIIMGGAIINFIYFYFATAGALPAPPATLNLATMRGFVFFLGLLVKLSLAQEPCIPPAGKPNCVCDTPGGTIDLSSLSNTDGSAR